MYLEIKSSKVIVVKYFYNDEEHISTLFNIKTT